MIEAQIRNVTGAVTHARRRGAVQVAVRPEAETAYDQVLQEKMWRTVWVTGGCRSWYLNDAGHNVSLGPDFTWAFAWQTRRFEWVQLRGAPTSPTVTRAADHQRVPPFMPFVQTRRYFAASVARRRRGH
jgi:hypothetical protein